MTDDFRAAVRAFELFTLSDKRAALEVFASLGYARVEDRLLEAVYQIIEKDKNTNENAKCSPSGDA